MKINTKLILLLMLLVLPAAASAVTDKEMEHARTIAAKAYLRYANDLSGYLDNIHPTTMAELDKSLKNKEKENIKAFKAIPVPTDYQTWDRQKLEEYWGTTVFKSKGLLEKGRAGKIGAKRDLKKMTVGAPEAKAEQPKPAADVAKTQKEEPKPGQPKDSDAAKAVPAGAAQATEAAIDSISAAEASLETATGDLDGLEEEDPEIEKASNHTWIYILILCVLIGVVVALVVFASNVMKKNGLQNGGARKGQERPGVGIVSSEASALRNDYADKLYAKSQEITDLNKKLQAQIKAGEALQKNLDSLLAENGRLHAHIAELQNMLKSQKIEAPESQAPQTKAQIPQDHQAYQPKAVQPSATEQSHQAYQPQPTSPQPQQAQQPRQEWNGPSHRTIFLGRVNPRNKFVRADRALNPGHTVFQLETSDGLTGTYRVVADPSVWEIALANPYDILAGGCNVADIVATAGKQKVVNDQAGTAIFEGGCWQVLRKAKVHFE